MPPLWFYYRPKKIVDLNSNIPRKVNQVNYLTLIVCFDEPNSLVQMDFVRCDVHSYVVIFNYKS